MVNCNGDVSSSLDLRSEFSWHLEAVAAGVHHWDDDQRNLGNWGLIAASAAIHVSSNREEIFILNELSMASRLHLRHQEGIFKTDGFHLTLLLVLLRYLILYLSQVDVK